MSTSEANWDESVLIEKLNKANAADFVAYDLQDKECFDKAIYEGSRTVKTRLIYNRLIATAYKALRDKDLAIKLGRRGLESTADNIQSLHDHFANTKGITNGYVNIQFDLVQNALCTSHRWLATQATTTASRKAKADKCHFCGIKIDNAKHIYGACNVIMLARTYFSGIIDLDLDYINLGAITFYDSSLLSFKFNNANITKAIVIFNATSWILRRTYFMVSNLMNSHTAASHIARNAAYNFKFNNARKSKRSKAKALKDKQNYIEHPDLINNINNHLNHNNNSANALNINVVNFNANNVREGRFLPP